MDTYGLPQPLLRHGLEVSRSAVFQSMDSCQQFAIREYVSNAKLHPRRARDGHCKRGHKRGHGQLQFSLEVSRSAVFQSMDSCQQFSIREYVSNAKLHPRRGCAKDCPAH